MTAPATLERPTPAAPHPLPIVGLRDISVMFDVKPRTPTIWAERRESTGFPEPDGYLSGYVPYWLRERIVTWGDASGRSIPNPNGLAPLTGMGARSSD